MLRASGGIGRLGLTSMPVGEPTRARPSTMPTSHQPTSQTAASRGIPLVSKSMTLSSIVGFLIEGEAVDAPVDAAAAVFALVVPRFVLAVAVRLDRKSTRLNSSHQIISYAVFCLKKKNINVSRYLTHIRSQTMHFR